MVTLQKKTLITTVHKRAPASDCTADAVAKMVTGVGPVLLDAGSAEESAV